MKKIYITIFTLVVLMISMTASVFAWFVDGQNKADVSGIQGTVVAPGIYIDFDPAINVDIEQLHDLMYLTNDDFSNNTYKDMLFQFATPIELTFLKSSIPENTNSITISLSMTIKSFNQFIDNNTPVSTDSLLTYYISETKNPNVNTIFSETHSSIINYSDNFQIEINKNQDKKVYLFFWGNGEKLTNSDNQSIQIAQIRHEIVVNMTTISQEQ